MRNKNPNKTNSRDSFNLSKNTANQVSNRLQNIFNIKEGKKKEKPIKFSPWKTPCKSSNMNLTGMINSELEEDKVRSFSSDNFQTEIDAVDQK